VAKLLKEGADPNDISDRDGWCALHCAAIANNERIIRLLVAKGAQLEPTANDKYVRSYLFISYYFAYCCCCCCCCCWSKGSVDSASLRGF